MFKFLVKGLLRDKHRSVLPILVVSLGVMISVFMYTYMVGVFTEMLTNTSIWGSGHVKITSRAYLEEKDQIPNDLALDNSTVFMESLRNDYPEIQWSERILFGGLLDAFDENRETRAQSGVGGIAIDLFDPDSIELKRMSLESCLTAGRLPQVSREILLSARLAEQMEIKVNEEVTLITSTVNGSMSPVNLKVTGLFSLGMGAIDRRLIMADISDVRQILDMNDMSSEILGFFDNPYYDDIAALEFSDHFNADHPDTTMIFGPVANSMLDDSNMREYYAYSENAGTIVVMVMIIAMGIVLWNAGLLGGIRRYGEMGLRLAMGETKGQVYRSLLSESLFVGIVGTIIGTAIGLAFSYYVQEVGIDITKMSSNSEMGMPNILRARIDSTAYYLGFFPGVMATFVGAALSGIGIFKRETATLFKELES